MRATLTFFALAISSLPATAACDVRLKGPVPECPAVTYSPEDCFADMPKTGKAGDKIASYGQINMMSSGHAYFCMSHSSCIPMELISFNQCVLTYSPRDKEESKEYLGHITVTEKQVPGHTN